MTADSLVPSASTGSEPAPPREAATQAVRVGLWASAARCVLTYVVAPAGGLVGLVLGPAGLLLQVLGAITATAGARRLWYLGHWSRLPYAGLALAVDATTVAVLARALGEGLR
ncbi:MAG: hypothetical protein QM747_14900 [Nocardioides sp.]